MQNCTTNSQDRNTARSRLRFAREPCDLRVQQQPVVGAQSLIAANHVSRRAGDWGGATRRRAGRDGAGADGSDPAIHARTARWSRTLSLRGSPEPGGGRYPQGGSCSYPGERRDEPDRLARRVDEVVRVVEERAPVGIDPTNRGSAVAPERLTADVCAFMSPPGQCGWRVRRARGPSVTVCVASSGRGPSPACRRCAWSTSGDAHRARRRRT